MAASENDLGNLYATTGRPAEAARAYANAITSAEAAHDDALVPSLDLVASNVLTTAP
jgi:hypothetical protein